MQESEVTSRRLAMVINANSGIYLRSVFGWKKRKRELAQLCTGSLGKNVAATRFLQT